MPGQGADSRISNIGLNYNTYYNSSTNNINSRIIRNPNTFNTDSETASQEQINTVRTQVGTVIAQVPTSTINSSFNNRVKESTSNSLRYLDNIPSPPAAARETPLPDYNPGTKRNRSERKAYVEEHMQDGLWDVDGDGVTKHATDGQLIDKFIRGKRGDKLSKYISKDSKLTIAQVEAKLQRLLDGGALDTDNDGKNEKSDGRQIHDLINKFD